MNVAFTCFINLNMSSTVAILQNSNKIMMLHVVALFIAYAAIQYHYRNTNNQTRFIRTSALIHIVFQHFGWQKKNYTKNIFSKNKIDQCSHR